MAIEVTVLQTLNGQIHKAIDVLVKERIGEIISAITPVVITGVSLYIVIYAYMIMSGRIQEPFKDFMVKCVKIILISTAGLNAQFYGSYIYNAINGLQLGLSNTISGNQGESVFGSLDNLILMTLGLVSELVDKISSYDFIDLAFIGLYTTILIGLLIATLIIILTAATIIMIADVILQLLVAVGPIFIACLLFQPTQKFFEAWFNQVVTTVLKISFALFTSTIAIKLYIMFYKEVRFSDDSFNSLIAIVELIGIAYIMSKVISESSSLASSMGNGMSIGGNGITGKDMLKTVSSILKKAPNPKAQAIGQGLDAASKATGGGGAGGAGAAGGGRSTPAYQRAFLNKLK